MKIKILIISIFLFWGISAQANNLEKIDYTNIKVNQKIFYDGTNWSKAPKKAENYIVKKVPNELDVPYSEYYSSMGEFLFSTGTEYEFINKGCLIGYSNYDLKFYEFLLDDNSNLIRRELTDGEIQELFPNYRVIKISDFSNKTNGLKIKKKKSVEKIILLNDTDKFFYNYAFRTNDSMFKEYELKGFLNIKKKGMLHFSKFGENSPKSHWYVLLVR